MTLTVRPVLKDYVAQTWPLVKDFIAETLPHCGDDYTLDQVLMHLTLGTWVLLVSVDEQNKIHGAMTLNLYNSTNHRVAFVTTTAGKGICTPEALEQVKALMHSMGVTRIQAGCRPAMVRMLSKMGFKERHTVVEVNI